MTASVQTTMKIQPELGKRVFPRGSCDTHFHVFGVASEFPFIASRSYTPESATIDAYWSAYGPMGIDRCILVQPSVYGSDHGLLKKMLRHASPGTMRGVAVLFEDTSDREIEELHALGVRGARCNALFRGGVSAADLRSIADRVKGLGWHIQLLVDMDRDHALAQQVAAMGLPVVVDHFGHPSLGSSTDSRGLQILQELLKAGLAWVKFSGAYRISKTAWAGDPAVAAVARALALANPNRILWGSDWPHPGIDARAPSSTEIAMSIFDWLPPKMMHQVLIDNPNLLYWSN